MTHDTQITRQLERLKQLHRLTMHLSQIDELPDLQQAIAEQIDALMQQGQVIVLAAEEQDDQVIGLRFAGRSQGAASGTQDRLAHAYISTFNRPDDPIIRRWLAGETVTLDGHEPRISPAVEDLLTIAEIHRFHSRPLVTAERLLGVVILEFVSTLTDEDHEMLGLAVEAVTVVLRSTTRQAETMAQLAGKVHEMNIMQQIDRELNDTIALETVFDYTLDWALRFTNATAASIALYDEDEDRLRTRFHYGYSVSIEKYDELRSDHMSITHRVARNGEVEIMPDVRMDKDYVPIAGTVILSQMAVPVMREDRVIAVMTLESGRLNAFNDDHIAFVRNLANRAAVAIDNARLYTEAVREREKLSHILSNIIDAVIVVGTDERIVLMNQSAVNALSLYTDTNYNGQFFANAIDYTPLIDIYRRARSGGEGVAEEMTLPNHRIFYTKADQYSGIGWIIVMQDVTPYKEMDQLKSELIATVSHDLKQPLSVMQGYLELLDMRNQFDDSSQGFVIRIDKSIQNMRSLIDDLLDLARIEAGIDLKTERISIQALLMDCVEALRPAAIAKQMTLETHLPDHLPPISGERARLTQIFNNLIGNAIKYTQPEGQVSVIAEQRDRSIRVAVRDNGHGIGPEDQAHIFERFYRVRRPENEGIDGTGLGLAIVKSLVEAHRGTIRLESAIGQGSTFYVTLPIEDDSSTVDLPAGS